MFPRILPTSRAARSLRTHFDHARRMYSNETAQVLLMDDILLSANELARLETQAQVFRNQATNRAELIEAFRPGGPYANIQGLYRHFGGNRSIRISGRFDAELVNALPPSLKFIVHNGAGYDQLDIGALTARGIQASNVPVVTNAPTADTALFLLLGSLRRFPLAMAQLHKGVFNSEFPFTTASNPEGLVLGIVGAGGIGSELARKAANALGMRVIYHNRNRLANEREVVGMPAGLQMSYRATLKELLEESDAVSLHCPLTPETHHLIGAEQLKQMRPHAVLINTARGPVVDEAALVNALETDEIAGAGLDVYEEEPKIHPGLVALSETKALLVPHVGTLTLQTQTNMETACLRNLAHGLDTGALAFTVKEQAGLNMHA
ncbi:glyoxylate reductase [Malassezia vespertilionis]|uniref:2-hydroxyacid dehydrogenase n=1 Tax=Malassezia vespertilionis TaxID=2020962 RepID=A0A2N1JAI3_9BASI|nr:glyoxylate reductase [Malassezia vespertilionis]PKI83561.1 hypothetical protein MVES_002715 [Malassezia vespertilionis]WFD07503.1 glyoxylate reductase [Malassezia vespertilionis]